MPVTESHPVPKGNTIIRDSKVQRNRARSWCFTLNNYKEEDVVTLSHPKWNNMRTKRICFQEEMGEEEKTPHLQGVVQFEESVSFTTLKSFHDKIHWEKCRNLAASIKYCSKNDTKYGKLYTHGVSEKQLWRGKSKAKLMDTREVYEDMCDQMKKTMALNRPYVRDQDEYFVYKKPEWLVAFEEDLSDSTPSPSPGEKVASLQPPAKAEGALGC